MFKFVHSVRSIFRKQFAPTIEETGSKVDESLFLPQSSVSCFSDAPQVKHPLLHHTGVTIGAEFTSQPTSVHRLEQWRLAQEEDTSDFHVLKSDDKKNVEDNLIPRLNAVYFMRAFLKQCREHQSFLRDSICIDEHVLSTAYIYYRW